MGLVAAVFKIMPSSSEGTGKIKEEIKRKFKVQDIKETPVAFGIKLIEVMLIFDDSAGIGNIEQELAAIDGVASVESGDATLI